jgi:hypothetical protein
VSRARERERARARGLPLVLLAVPFSQLASFCFCFTDFVVSNLGCPWTTKDNLDYLPQSESLLLKGIVMVKDFSPK